MCLIDELFNCLIVYSISRFTDFTIPRFRLVRLTVVTIHQNIISMYLFSFEKLEVWKDARTLAKMVYELTACFPKSEVYGLVSQMNRSVISISSNIAEGSGRLKPNDKARFMHIAFGSLMELLNQLIISNDLGWTSEEKLLDVRAQIEKVANKLNALEKVLLKNG